MKVLDKKLGNLKPIIAEYPKNTTTRRRCQHSYYNKKFSIDEARNSHVFQ